MKHTPGPWNLSIGAHGDREARRILAKSGIQIASIGDGWNPPNDTVEANARLIAAAPEMLEELMHCVGLLEAIHESPPTRLNRVRALIRKATGEPDERRG